MCDTVVAVGEATTSGNTILGKNSDRDPNEPHNILHVPRTKHEESMVRTTYIEIPQVRVTNEVLLLKPSWIWGAEMGANEFGVAIGNEAIWTRAKLERKSLIGMDLLRLALERGRTARESLDTIVSLLQEYGQGGECGYDHSSRYHNSFIIADPKEAWILETAGRFWIAQKVKSIATISNVATIESEFDLIHPDLISYAIKKGYTKNEDTFNFAKDMSKKFMPWAAKGNTRRACTFNILKNDEGKITPSTVMAALRSHNTTTESYNPQHSTMASPCVHASSFLTPTQSTGSYVGDLREDLSVHWATGTSAPCTSVFKPLILGSEPYDFFQGSKHYNPQSVWWRHERIHRLVILDYDRFMSLYRQQQVELENQFLEQVYSGKIWSLDREERLRRLRSLSEEHWNLANKKEAEWFALLQKSAYENEPRSRFALRKRRYYHYWKRWNRRAKLPSWKREYP